MVVKMKKVTLQEIAKSLNISRTTVWKVFHGHEGVSKSLRDKIIAKAQELDYELPPDIGRFVESPDPSQLNITVAVCRPDTSVFWMAIIHQIAKELSARQVNLIYTYLPSSAAEGYALPPSLLDRSIHGMIVINVYDADMIRRLSSLPIPKVFLDTAPSIPPRKLNGDLLLMENRSSVEMITSHLIAKGKKELGFIGDIHYALSNRERFDGFLRAVRHHGISVNQQYIFTFPVSQLSYKESIQSFLDSLPCLPDAFVCANDHVACILMQLLMRQGIRIPEDVAISGFDADTEFPLSEDLTTVQVYSQNIGFRLVQQILYRIQYPENPLETTYLATQVIFRKSTGD